MKLFRFMIVFIFTVCIVQVEAQCVWVGGSLGNLTNWHTASNWTGTGCGFGSSVPAIDDAVTIPTTIYDPVITAASNAASVAIDPSADVTITTGGDLTVDGQITIAALGAFNMDDGNLAFMGVSNFIVNLGTWNVTGGKVHLSRSVDDTQVFNDNNVFNNVTIDGGRIVTMTTAINNVNTITISGGSTLDIVTDTLTGSGGGKLKIKNNCRLMLSGTSNFPTGFATYELEEGSFVEYYLNGAQTIAEHDYWHLDLTGGGTKTIITSETVGVHGVLDIEDGATLATLGYGAGAAYIRLISTGEADNQTAKIGDLSDESLGFITGDGVMCERYIDLTNPDKVYWNDWCSPLTNLYLKSWYYTGWPMTGVGGTDYPNNPFCSVLQYDATTIGTEYGAGNGILDKNDGWLRMASINDVVTNGRGVRIYTGARNRIMQDLGTPRIGNLQINLDYYNEPTADQMQEGWNLIGNPYMSTIDFDDINFNKISDGSPASGGIDSTTNDYINAFWVYSNNNGYYTYNGLTGIGTVPYFVNAGNFLGVSDASLISSHKAFWVKVYNTNVRIDFEESDKDVGGTQFVKNAVSSTPKIRVQVENLSNGLKNAAVNAFVSESSVMFDSYDAAFLGSANASAPSVYFLSDDNHALAVNTVPWMSQEIKLHINPGVAGSVSLTFYDLQNIPQGVCLWLEDKQTNEWFEVIEDAVWNRDLAVEDTLERFVLHINHLVELVNTKAITCFGNQDGELVITTDKDSLPIAWYKNEEFIQNYVINKELVVSGLSAGAYTIVPNLTSGCVNAAVNITLEEPMPLLPKFSMSNNTIDLLENNGEVTFINTSPSSGVVTWQIEGDSGVYQTDTLVYKFTTTGWRVVQLMVVANIGQCVAVKQDSVLVINVNTGINAQQEGNNVQAYFSNNTLYFSKASPGVNSIQLIVTDVSGKIVWKQKFTGMGEEQIAIPWNKPMGVYFLKFSMEEKQDVVKLISN